MVTERNKLDNLQEISETHNLNDEYENFVTGHMEATAECIPPKPRPPRESLVVTRKQEDNMEIASLLDKINPINAKPQKLKAHRELTHTKKRN